MGASFRKRIKPLECGALGTAFKAAASRRTPKALLWHTFWNSWGQKGRTNTMSADAARVLIIEDDDALRVMLFTILRHQPLGVDTATNADDAMAKVQECDYALILIDLNLPDGESNIFLSRFREERPQRYDVHHRRTRPGKRRDHGPGDRQRRSEQAAGNRHAG